MQFKSVATKWGSDHEHIALECYKQSMKNHVELLVNDCGLIVNVTCPFLGASPDALVSCKCCGNGAVEVKCPYSNRIQTILQYMESDNSCFCFVDGEISLRKSHSYHYQVQAQMHVCDVLYCDFVVCTFPSDSRSIFVFRVKRDTEFCQNCVKCASAFSDLVCYLSCWVWPIHGQPTNSEGIFCDVIFMSSS
jgi:hypothetical protein